MKKSVIYKKILRILILFYLLFVPSVYAANNPYPKYQSSPFGGQEISCTWYAWQQAHDRMNVDLPFWTNVETWYSKASKAGYSVGKTPKANSIMIWNYGEGFGGHAAYVTVVNGTTVIFDEGGSPMTSDGINIGEQYTLDEMNGFLVGFIYLDVPRVIQEKPQTNKPTTNNSTTNTQKKEETKPVVKSSDNTLSGLSIEGIKLEFSNEKLEYQFEVPYDLQNIKITATPNDSKATIIGNGNYNLEIGGNNFIIKVTAEDGSIKEYKINITRKEEEKIEEPNVKNDAKKEENSQNVNIEKKDNNKIIIAAIAISLVAITIIGIIIYKIIKRK